MLQTLLKLKPKIENWKKKKKTSYLLFIIIILEDDQKITKIERK